MSIVRRFSKRYWSLFAALSILFLESYADRVPGELVSYQSTSIDIQNASNAVLTLCFIYGVGTAICLGLMAHSWTMQRRYAKNKWRLVFWVHVLIFPALAVPALGLHQIQTYTYELAADFQRWGGGRWYQSLHFYAEDAGDKLIWLAMLDLVLIVVWTIVAAYKNRSGRPASEPA
jgi:hypothetical protein